MPDPKALDAILYDLITEGDINLWYRSLFTRRTQLLAMQAIDYQAQYAVELADLERLIVATTKAVGA